MKELVKQVDRKQFLFGLNSIVQIFIFAIKQVKIYKQKNQFINLNNRLERLFVCT